MTDQPQDFEYRGIVVRAPEDLHRCLLREQARRTIDSGRKPTLESIVIELIQVQYGQKKARKAPIRD
jgi:hypothetical protein